MKMDILKFIYYHTKALFMKRYTWVLVGALVLLCLIFGGIRIPDVENTMVGVVMYGNQKAADIVNRMGKETEIYKFVEYDNPERLKEDISIGALECGFIFDEDYDSLYERDRLYKSVEYISSPYTTKGIVAKERFFAAYLKEYSEVILKEESGRIFADNDSENKKKIEDMLLDRNAYYLSGDEVFEVDFK